MPVISDGQRAVTFLMKSPGDGIVDVRFNSAMRTSRIIPLMTFSPSACLCSICAARLQFLYPSPQKAIVSSPDQSRSARRSCVRVAIAALAHHRPAFLQPVLHTLKPGGTYGALHLEHLPRAAQARQFMHSRKSCRPRFCSITAAQASRARLRRLWMICGRCLNWA